MEMRQLQYFAAIARMGGLRQAADSLEMSPGTLSEQLKLLEQELDVRLFERGHRKLVLTEAGRTLLQRTERALLELKTAREEMRDFAQLERGELIVGALPGLGPFWLSRFLIDFLRDHPHVGLRLIERNSTILLKLLDAGEIHVACVLMPVDRKVAPERVSVRHLTIGDLAVVVSPEHPIAQQASIRLEQLSSERLILTAPDETPRLIVDDAFRAIGLEPDVYFEANDPITLVQLAAAGIGVGITGDAIGRGHAPTVVTVPIDGPPLRYALSVAWPAQRGPHTRALRTFLSYIENWWLQRNRSAPTNVRSETAD
jgi:LysR family transcriptional activator of glutamate synthase operon